MGNSYRLVAGLGLGVAIALGLSSGTGDRAWAYDTGRCQQVRAVRLLAIQAGLDGGNLAALEALYCQRTQPSRSNRYPETSSECEALTVMAQLARLEAGQSDLARATLAQQQVACNVTANRFDRQLRYPNGQTVRFGSSWYYPNGQSAQFGSSWNYPSGAPAKFGDRWNYPNGAIARFGSSWRAPSGQQVSEQQLLTWACSFVPASECNQRLLEIRSRSGDGRDVAILELAWRADQLGARSALGQRQRS